jgi:hypothetical protein
MDTLYNEGARLKHMLSLLCLAHRSSLILTSTNNTIAPPLNLHQQGAPFA